MPRYQRILVPVDFSDHSRIALEHASDLCRALGAELHLLHVNEPWPPAASVTSEAYPMFHEFVVEENARATQALSDIVVADVDPRKIQRAIRSGHVEHEILKYIDDAAIDLAVIGTHGRTGISHWIMGSVAERVVRFASCPVLVARSRTASAAAK